MFRKYKAIHFVYPNFNESPKRTLTFFMFFCKEFGFKSKIITNPKEFDIEKDIAYIGVSDRMLGMFLEQCREKDFEPGKDVGFLSYNETPMKKFIYKRISVVSTDFKGIRTKIRRIYYKRRTDARLCIDKINTKRIIINYVLHWI